MSLADPVVITCAISGTLANREQCPAIPYTPEEYAAEARRIVDEGGVHIHIHAHTNTHIHTHTHKQTSSILTLHLLSIFPTFFSPICCLTF